MDQDSAAERPQKKVKYIINFGFVGGWMSFITSLVYGLRAPVEVNVEVVVIALTGVIAVVSTLIGVINTAKNDAFKNSQQINEKLEEQIEKMEEKEVQVKVDHQKRVADLEARIETLKLEQDLARSNRISNEDYIRLLVRTLSDAQIPVPPYIHPPV